LEQSAAHYYQKGWQHFEFDPKLFDWVQIALPFAESAINEPKNAQWLRSDGTWFVGVNALPNTYTGAIGDSGPLGGDAVSFIRNEINISRFEFDQAQISVCYPGYPRPSADESHNAYLYRVKRDAAHVDGFRAQGDLRRRFLDEYHHFILGIPLVEFSEDAAPFVVWEGSHGIIRSVMLERYKNIPTENWVNEDVTDAYKEARSLVFKQCKRVEISAKPGEAFLAHRLTVHGIAPWSNNATADPRGRMMSYFRPEGKDANSWLTDL
jgi:hypothetical protein